MKSFTLLVIICLSITVSGQQKVTLDDGTKVLLFHDRTWRFESEVNENISTNIDTARIIINLSNYCSVHREPKINSVNIENFPKNKIEIIDYLDRFFTVKAPDGRIGYVNEFSVDNNQRLSQEIIDRLVSIAQSRGKNLINELPRSRAVEVSFGSQFFHTKRSFGELTPKRLDQ